MNRLKRWLIPAAVVVGLTIAATVLITVARDGTDRQRQEITIGYFSKAIGYAPYYVARHHGWFEEHPALAGWSIRHVEFGDRPTISQSFDSGDLQYLLSADIPAIMSRAQGNDIRIVNVSGLITLQWLVRSDLSAQVVSDLRGERVAFLPGTSSHYGFLTSLRSARISSEDLRAQHMEPPEARDAFESRQIEAWIVWSPFYEQQIINGQGRPLAGTDYQYAVTGAATSSFIAEHGEQVQALIDVLRRGKEWIASNPEATSSIVAEATGQTTAVVERALTNIDYSASLDGATITMFQSMADFVAAQGKTRLDRAVDVRNELVGTRFRQN